MFLVQQCVVVAVEVCMFFLTCFLVYYFVVFTLGSSRSHKKSTSGSQSARQAWIDAVNKRNTGYIY